MDSLKDLLIQKNLEEPTEITALRDYYQQTFKLLASIKVTPNNIVLIVPNSKLATEVRARTLDIQRRCQLTKKLFIKVGKPSR